MKNQIQTCIFKFTNSLIILFVFSSCAQIVIPGGGPKDVQPPRVEKYIPDSAATNFTEKTITISFDEYIQLTDLQKQLTVSPPMATQPEIKAKGKVLLIDLKDSLKKNTTYSINFGNSIRDFTESNAKKDFQYIFSTGSYIDSLKLNGTIKNALDMKPEKEVLVMLYDTFEDSVPSKTLPSYFAKTKDDGTYRINNIRPGVYKAFALKDANANYLYDVPTESIAFFDTLIKIEKNKSLDMMMFREIPKKQRLLKDFVKGYGSVVLAYAKPVETIFYTSMNGGTKTSTFLTEFNTGRDTITVWFPTFTSDSLHFQVTVNKAAIDTIKICTCLFEKKGRGAVFKLNVTANVTKDKPFDYNNEIKLRFNHPISNTKTEAIELRSGAKKINFINKFFSDSINRNFFFQYPFVQDSTYQLFIPPATFTDIFGLTNDSIKIDFKTQEEKYYGTFKMNIKINSTNANYIVQLLDEKGAFTKEKIISNAQTLNYSYLHPGKYKLKIIYDVNGDGKWTTGSYSMRQQPEKIIYYPDDITIRSNWDLELDWKVE